MCSALKGPQRELLRFLLGYLRRKKCDRRQWFVLELVPLRGKKTPRYAHKTGSWYLLGEFLGVLFKISDEQPSPFELESPSRDDLTVSYYPVNCSYTKKLQALPSLLVSRKHPYLESEKHLL